MASLDRTFREEMKKFPRFFLEQMIKEKLAEIEAPELPGLVDALVDHIVERKGETFDWKGDDPSSEIDQNFTLDFTAEDVARLEERITKFLDGGVQELVQEILEKTTKSVFKRIKRDWPEQQDYQRAVLANFQCNLDERWGDAFDLLRILHTLALEAGEKYFKRIRRSNARKKILLRDVLGRLHARACQVSGEIITLIEHGYADGAMARWRTLHEIATVARIIADGGEELAERYVDHYIIENKAEMDEFERCHDRLGYKSISKRDKKQIERAYDVAIQKYGKEFGSQYGWAAEYLSLRKPILSDLERAAEHAHMRSYYKFASQNVHAGAKRLTYQLGSLGDADVIVAGMSNAGLDAPGRNTAISLMQITALLDEERISNMDVMIQTKVLLLLCDRAEDAFIRAGRKLEREEAALSRKRG